MALRILYSLIWISFTLYAFVLAPPTQPDTFELIQDLSLLHWDEINPWIISLFNGMGLWPMVYCALLFRDGQRQSLRAWPFAIASFFIGAFAILPYLALRNSSPDQAISDSAPIKFWESRILGLLISLGFMVLLGYGLLEGNWSAFGSQWSGDRFIHIMGLDFCLLSILAPSLTLSDRELRATTWPLWVDFIPVIGVLLYLCLRPTSIDQAAMSDAP